MKKLISPVLNIIKRLILFMRLDVDPDNGTMALH